MHINQATISMLKCEPISVTYNANISYVKGVMRIAYTKQGPRPYQSKLSVIFNDTTSPSGDDALNQQFQDWNEWALVDAVLGSLEVSCHVAFESIDVRGPEMMLSNGTSTNTTKLYDFYCDSKSEFGQLFPHTWVS